MSNQNKIFVKNHPYIKELVPVGGEQSISLDENGHPTLKDSADPSDRRMMAPGGIITENVEDLRFSTEDKPLKEASISRNLGNLQEGKDKALVSQTLPAPHEEPTRGSQTEVKAQTTNSILVNHRGASQVKPSANLNTSEGFRDNSELHRNSSQVRFIEQEEPSAEIEMKAALFPSIHSNQKKPNVSHDIIEAAEAGGQLDVTLSDEEVKKEQKVSQPTGHPVQITKEAKKLKKAKSKDAKESKPLISKKRSKSDAENMSSINKSMTVIDENDAEYFNMRPQEQLGGISIRELEEKRVPKKDRNFLMTGTKVIQALRKMNQSRKEIESSAVERQTTESRVKTEGSEKKSMLQSQFYEETPRHTIREFNAGAKNQTKNKEVFRHNYGVEKLFPYNYVMDAKVCPQNISYVLKVVKYIIPEEDTPVRHFKEGRKPETTKMKQLFGESIYKKENVVLQLLHFQKNQVKVLKEVPILKAYLVNISFSKDGKYFSIFRRKLNNLQIYKINGNDIEDLMERVNRGEAFREYNQLSQLKNAQTMYFDIHSRFLACYGDHCVNIISLEEQQTTPPISLTIDVKAFSHIIDIQLVSSPDGQYRCDVACKRKDLNNILVFDINKEVNQRRNLTFLKPLNTYSKVKISEDFEKVALVHGEENYLLSRDDDGYCQQTMSWLRLKKVSHLFNQGSEFFFICNDDYDHEIDIISSSYQDFKISIPKRIEPQCLTICDAVQADINEEGFGTRMVITSARDSDFYYDVINPMINLNKIKAISPAKQVKVKYSRSRTTERPQVDGTGTSRTPIESARQKEEIKKKKKGGESALLFSMVYTQIQAHRAQWPYVSFSTLKNMLCLFNAFDHAFVNFIDIPGGNSGFVISQTYLTEQEELFIACRSNAEQKYQIWKIDVQALNQSQWTDPVRFVFCFEYTFDDCNNKPLQDMIIRSASRKGIIDMNKKLIAFFLHKGELYSWQKHQKKINFVSQTQTRYFCQINEDEFYFRNDQTVITPKDVFTLLKVKIMFSTFQISCVYEEKQTSKADGIKAHAIDYKKKILVLMYKTDKNTIVHRNRFKLVDIEKQQAILNVNVTDTDIVGRFKSGLFTFVDGHFYFGNSVIKLRYDLIERSKTLQLSDNQVFDKYQDLLDLKPTEKVHSKNPIICNENHRQIYFTRNMTSLTPMRLIILPFLHERKLYINRIDRNHKYFYTVIEESLEEPKSLRATLRDGTKKQRHPEKITLFIAMDMTAQKFMVYTEQGILLRLVDISKEFSKYGEPIQVSSNGKNFIFQQPDEPQKISILSLTQYSLVYIKQFKLIDAINSYIDDIAAEAKSQSEKIQAKRLRAKINEDYLTYFLPSYSNFIFQINDNLDVCIQISSMLEFELFQELNYSFNHEEIPYIQKLLKLLGEQAKKGMGQRMLNKMGQMVKERKLDIEDPIETEIKQLKKKLSFATQEMIQSMAPDLQASLHQILEESQGSLFYIQKGSVGLKGCEISQLQTQFIDVDEQTLDFDDQALIFSKDYPEFILGQDIGNFVVNSKYVLFWNNFMVFYFDLSQTKGHVQMKITTLDFLVNPEEKQTFVRRIRAGSDPSRITIVVRQSVHSDCVIVWDMIKDIEQTSFDLGNKSKVFFDAMGDTYITEKDSMIICEQGVCLKSYDVMKVGRSSQENVHFDYYKGHRFDYKNHNWILFNEYLSLSFSFMTLVIRDRSQQEESYIDENFLFDPEQYTFIINRKNCFTCDNFVGEDYEKLQYVLTKFEENDPVLLEQLHYFYVLEPEKEEETFSVERDHSFMDINSPLILKKEKKQEEAKKITPLHLALREGNNRSINIILKFMAKIDYNASDTIKDILPQLLEYKELLYYMDQLPFQTIQMMNKQTLRVKKHFSDEIVSINRSNRSYIDDYYYAEEMGEQKDNEQFMNFPVNVMAFKIDWVLQDKAGILFLQNMLNSQKLELYENRTILVIVEFLYKHYRRVILRYRLPIYLFQLVFFQAAVQINEQYNYNAANSSGETSESLSMLQNISAFINMMLTLYSLAMVCIQGRAAGQTYFKSIWAFFDIIYVVINGIVSIALLFNGAVEEFGVAADNTFIHNKTLRMIEAILSIVIIVKLIYFTQLMDEIAPLVNIIILIFKDIFWFLVIFLVTGFSFGLSFNLIGQNQFDEQYDIAKTEAELENPGAPVKIDPENLELPLYHSLGGAMQHVYLLSLGEFSVEEYDIGDGSQAIILWVLFLLASFLLVIHFLNMLIAIMGETFSQNNETKRIQQIQSHLRFVLDNLYIDPISNKDRITYLVTAFFNEEDSQEQEYLSEINQKVDELGIKMKKDVQKLMVQMNTMQAQIQGVLTNQANA